MTTYSRGSNSTNPTTLTRRTPRHLCSLIIPAIPSNATTEPSSNVEKTFIKRCSSSRTSLNSTNTSMNSSMNQLLMESQASMQTLTLPRSNSFGSATSTSGSTISAPTVAVPTSNNVHVKPFRQLGAIASPIHPRASSPMEVMFEEYILIPTSDGRLLVYQISDFQYAEKILLEEEMSSFPSSPTVVSSNVNGPWMNNSMNIHGHTSTNIKNISSQVQQEKMNQLPIETIGPLYVGEYKAINIGSNESLSQVPLKDKPSAIIIGLVGISTSTTGFGDTSILGHVAVMTLQGDVFVFEFCKSVEDGSSLQVKPFCAFGCDRISGQCIAIRRRRRGMELLIACGFLDGTIQEYQVEKNKKILCWEGFLNRQQRICCVSYITSFSSENSVERDPDSFIQLVVGMSQRDVHPMGRLSTEEVLETCLEVISVQIARNTWQQKGKEFGSSSTISVSLIECTVWPIHERRDLTRLKGSNSSSSEKKISRKASHEQQFICAITTTMSSFSVAISNGAIVTFHYWIDYEGKFCWGLDFSKTQRILPFPSSNLSLLNEYMVSCGRDASVWIWPWNGENESENDRVIIPMIPYEPIGFDDDMLRYTLGFCAGHLRAKIWGVHRDSNTKYLHRPVLAFAWAGGVVDCYTVDLSSCLYATYDFDSVLKSIADEGILSNVFSLFGSYTSPNRNHDDEDSLISRAAREYKMWKRGDDELISCLLNKKLDGITAINHFIVAFIRKL